MAQSKQQEKNNLRERKDKDHHFVRAEQKRKGKGTTDEDRGGNLSRIIFSKKCREGARKRLQWVAGCYKEKISSRVEKATFFL